MNNITTPDDAIRVYWMTGCSSCLRTKEFLTRHGAPFISRNVLEDDGAYDDVPAHAGMAPLVLLEPITNQGCPRPRGDGLIGSNSIINSEGMSPPTRGWPL